MTLEGLRKAGEVVKIWSECIAYLSGGSFLIYKVLSGYFITDLSLKLQCERLTSETGDSIAVTATLKKGDKGTIRIHDVRVRLTTVDGQIMSEKSMIGVQRLSFNTDPSGQCARLSNETPKPLG